MNSLAVEIPRVCSIDCTEQELIVCLADGRPISVFGLIAGKSSAEFNVT